MLHKGRIENSISSSAARWMKKWQAITHGSFGCHIQPSVGSLTAIDIVRSEKQPLTKAMYLFSFPKKCFKTNSDLYFLVS